MTIGYRIMRDDVESQRWLGYELHDGLLQWVVGARMQLETAILRDPDSVVALELKRALKYMELAIEEGRSLIGFIDTGRHDEPGEFQELLERFVNSIAPLLTQRSQTIELQMNSAEWPSLPSSVAWNAFRIVEQAVRNAIKHAGPAQILIRTEKLSPSALRLVVQDNGVGIKAVAPDHAIGHFGLASMRHRASILGGNLQIEPGTEGGTVVSFEFSTTP